MRKHLFITNCNEKQCTQRLIPKTDVTEPKARRLDYSNNQLKSCLQVKGQC